jgi:hypothetical protein
MAVAGQSGEMNRFEVRRLDYSVDIGGGTESWDLVVPVIDGVPLADRLTDRAPGTWTSLVAPPSQHWFGHPVSDPYDADDGRAEVLTGACGESGCCGVFARVTVGDTSVVWAEFSARGAPDLPDGLSFEFDRVEYEAALDHLGGPSGSEPR